MRCSPFGQMEPGAVCPSPVARVKITVFWALLEVWWLRLHGVQTHFPGTSRHHARCEYQTRPSFSAAHLAVVKRAPGRVAGFHFRVSAICAVQFRWVDGFLGVGFFPGGGQAVAVGQAAILEQVGDGAGSPFSSSERSPPQGDLTFKAVRVNVAGVPGCRGFVRSWQVRFCWFHSGFWRSFQAPFK